MKIEFQLNNKNQQLDVDPQTPLLWALRDVLRMTGTKFGCGIGQCGACTVHLDGVAIRSCSVPVGTIAGHHITTIEGLSTDGLHPVQEAWIAEEVPQCGYCQPGQIMSAVALLRSHPNPDDDTINREMTNLCRCGTYPRIRKGIKRAAETLRSKKP